MHAAEGKQALDIQNRCKLISTKGEDRRGRGTVLRYVEDVHVLCLSCLVIPLCTSRGDNLMASVVSAGRCKSSETLLSKTTF